MFNNFRVPNIKVNRARAKEYGVKYGGLPKGNNIKDCGYDLDLDLYGIWLEAVNICALRSMRIPREIIDDFYYVHKEKNEEILHKSVIM